MAAHIHNKTCKASTGVLQPMLWQHAALLESQTRTVGGRYKSCRQGFQHSQPSLPLGANPSQLLDHIRLAAEHHNRTGCPEPEMHPNAACHRRPTLHGLTTDMPAVQAKSLAVPKGMSAMARPCRATASLCFIKAPATSFSVPSPPPAYTAGPQALRATAVSVPPVMMAQASQQQLQMPCACSLYTLPLPKTYSSLVDTLPCALWTLHSAYCADHTITHSHCQAHLQQRSGSL